MYASARRESAVPDAADGTIITNKAIDVFCPYKFLNPAVFGNSFYAFRNRYFDMVGYGNHTDPEDEHDGRADAADSQHRVPGYEG